MAEKYLNEGCKFSCSHAFGLNLFRAIENGEPGIKINGRKALTNRAMLFPAAPGPSTMCRMQPNPLGPQPYFPCLLSGVSWQKTSKNIGSGYNLLTEASRAVCQKFLGELSVIGPVGITCVQGIAESFEILTTAASEIHKGTSGESVSEKSDVPELQTDWMLCPYSPEKEKCTQCEYVHARADAVVMAASSKVLRSNYKQSFGSLALTRSRYRNMLHTYEEEMELFSRQYTGNAAHHIISAKDVLQYPGMEAVLKLVNFYQYNINEAYNCILLPGIEGIGQLVETKKTEEKYRIMSAVKRQWHGGSHAYSADSACEGTFKGSYAQTVSNLVRQAMYSPENNKICRKEQYEKSREEFEKKMHKLIDVVRAKLIAFEQDPKKSSPYFVSADAFYYAYGMPDRMKFLFAEYIAKNKCRVYQYTACQNHPALECCEFQCEKEKTFCFDETKQRAELVRYCARIQALLLNRNRYDVRFPFTINTYFADCGKMPPAEYLAKNCNAVRIFLQEQHLAECRMAEEEKRQIIKKRLAEVKGGEGHK